MFTEFGASDSSSCPLALSDEEVTCYALATSRPKNRAGRIVFKETRHPVFKGVRRRNGNKWVCEMREPNKKNARIWLGTYPTAEMAARAHDVAALALRGKSACLNFADSAWKLPVPASLDVKVIQRVANEAALMFRPRKSRPEHQPEDLDSASGTISHEENNYSANEVYIDEEVVLDLPLLLADMARGLLLSPSPNYFEDVMDIWDYEESDALQFLLWGK